ncbi:MAG: acyloxyacyl hydrolase [Candidatus Omnitrophica bacterium]|nr:acyloxyacyl hydrolase [Candidatus Omnitrophota bacterium]
MLTAGIVFSILATVFGGLAVARQPAGSRLRVERLDLRTGYGWQYKSEARPTNFQIHPLLASAVIPITGEVGPAWLRGQAEWTPEIFLGMFTHPYERPLAGITPIQVKYTLAPRGRLRPYALLGSGVLYANINRRETRHDLNFNLQLGVGSYIRLTEKADLLLEYRHVHLSNAGIHDDNTGVNTHTFLAGVSLKE